MKIDIYTKIGLSFGIAFLIYCIVAIFFKDIRVWAPAAYFIIAPPFVVGLWRVQRLVSAEKNQ